jgi:hypothetical protein
MALQLSGKLADIQVLPSVAAPIYTNAASTVTHVKGILLHNTNITTPAEFGLHIVPDVAGAVGAASLSNRIANFMLDPGETLLFPLSISDWAVPLTDTNDTLQAWASLAGEVTALVVGVKDA